jgi:hypothetical protein
MPEGTADGFEEMEGALLIVGLKEGSTLIDGSKETVGALLGIADGREEGFSLGTYDGNIDGKDEPPLPFPFPLPEPLLPFSRPLFPLLVLSNSRKEWAGERRRNAIAMFLWHLKSLFMIIIIVNLVIK